MADPRNKQQQAVANRRTAQAIAVAARQAIKQAEMNAIAEGIIRSGKALERKREAERESIEALATGNGRVPVHLGYLRGAEGNVFNVVATLASACRQAELYDYVVSKQAKEVHADFRQRTYEQTMDLILAYYDDLDGSVAQLREDPEPRVDPPEDFDVFDDEFDKDEGDVDEPV